MNNEITREKNTDRAPTASQLASCAIFFGLLVLPGLANAQTSTDLGFFSGITNILKSIVNLLVFEWGYYIGIITLVINGYRWKTGRIDLMQLGVWVLGITIVLFAPNIVGTIRSSAGGPV